MTRAKAVFWGGGEDVAPYRLVEGGNWANKGRAFKLRFDVWEC